MSEPVEIPIGTGWMRRNALAVILGALAALGNGNGFYQHRAAQGSGAQASACGEALVALANAMAAQDDPE